MIVHVVQKGDTLWKLSKKYGVPLESIITANPQLTNPDMIDVGQKIHIPSPGESVEITPGIEPAPGNKPPVGAMEQSPMEDQWQGEISPISPITSASPLEPPVPPVIPSPPSSPSVGDSPLPVPSTPMHTAPPLTGPVPKWGQLWKYVVKHGDTMWKIAKQVGVTLDQLKAANPQVPNPDKIMPGQVINIPSHGMMEGASHHLSIKEEMTMPKEKLTAQKPPVIPPLPKEKLTAPKPTLPPPIPKEVPIMEAKPFKVEIPKVEVPKMEMPKFEMPKLPPVPAPAPHLDVVQQQLYYAPHYHPVFHPVMVPHYYPKPHYHVKCRPKKRCRKHKCHHHVAYLPHPHYMYPAVHVPHPVHMPYYGYPGVHPAAVTPTGAYREEESKN